MFTKFSIGQVWKYATRPGEDASLITIGQVDVSDESIGPIIHIAISNVDIPNASSPDGKTTFIGHLPYENQALEDSVTELVAEGAETDEYFDEGHALWKAAFDNEEAGVFSIPVTEAIDFIQASVG